MGLSSRNLEITVISGENIRVTEDAYVVVRAESLNCCTTRTAKDDGSNLLSWNHKFSLHVPLHARSITFEVQCNKFKGFRPIGVARIALSDLLDGAVPEKNQLQVFSYGLRDWEGKRNGVIRFAVGEAALQKECLKSAVETVARRGCGDRFVGIKVADDISNEVVGGVPF